MTPRIQESFVNLVDIALRYEVLLKKKPSAAAAPNDGTVNPNKRKFKPNQKKKQGKKKPAGGD